METRPVDSPGPVLKREERLTLVSSRGRPSDGVEVAKRLPLSTFEPAVARGREVRGSVVSFVLISKQTMACNGWLRTAKMQQLYGRLVLWSTLTPNDPNFRRRLGNRDP